MCMQEGSWLLLTQVETIFLKVQRRNSGKSYLLYLLLDEISSPLNYCIDNRCRILICYKCNSTFGYFFQTFQLNSQDCWIQQNEFYSEYECIHPKPDVQPLTSIIEGRTAITTLHEHQWSFFIFIPLQLQLLLLLHSHHLYFLFLEYEFSTVQTFWRITKT